MNKQRARGFTLIELMIVVAIVALIAAVAIPSYRGYVERANRADGQEILMSTAQRLERCFTTHGSYTAADCGVTFPIDSAEGHYRIPDPDGNLTATTFTLQAVPQGGQADDDCGTLTLSHTGARGAGGSDCW